MKGWELSLTVPGRGSTFNFEITNLKLSKIISKIRNLKLETLSIKQYHTGRQIELLP